MTGQAFQGIELLPATMPARQLFVLLHGVGASAADLLPLAQRIREAYPEAALLLPDGTFPFDGGGSGRQWFSIRDVTEENRVARVAEALPRLHALVQQAQQRCQVEQQATVLAGFSQGAIMALEFSALHDGAVGRVLAFSGRYARLPEQAPRLTTLHLLHGEADRVIPVSHAYAALERLQSMAGDVTLDVAPAAGHEINAELAGLAIHRLQTCIPLRTLQQAMKAL
ncbi:MAG TPA: esterase [Gallionellaceae bacterium]